MTITSFKDLKKSRTNSLSALKEEFTKLQNKTYDNNDDRFWYPAVDKGGNGRAIIRFLPAPPSEEVPFVIEYKHSFKGPTGLYYIENCLSTVGKEDPVNVFNGKLWATGNEKDKEQAREQKRKKSFISNIYVIKDPLNPENEGKVKLFRYGVKIFEKLNELMNPAFDDDPQINPFDLWEGANFEIRIATIDKYRNYDKSKFADPAPLFDDDEKLEEIWNSEYPLQPFVDAENKDLFKSYEDLEKKLNRVLGLNDTAPARVSKAREDAVEEKKTISEDEKPWVEDDTKAKESASAAEADDELDWLKKLADE